jgi:hypothetical protein
VSGRRLRRSAGDLLYDGASWDLALEGARGEGSRPPFDTVDVSRPPRLRESSRSLASSTRARRSWRAAPRAPRTASRQGSKPCCSIERRASRGHRSRSCRATSPSSERLRSPDRTERRTVGRSDRGEVVLEQLLAFDGRDLDLVLCSAACAGPRCGEVSLIVRGELPEPPPPNAAVRALFYAAEHPTPGARRRRRRAARRRSRSCCGGARPHALSGRAGVTKNVSARAPARLTRPPLPRDDETTSFLLPRRG